MSSVDRPTCEKPLWLMGPPCRAPIVPHARPGGRARGADPRLVFPSSLEASANPLARQGARGGRVLRWLAFPSSGEESYMVRLEFFDPSGSIEVTQPHAPRLTTLEGKRIGFVSN